MKESIANVWLLGIIIVFILIFAAYIAITVSYTKSFKMKNEMLHIIEKHKGMTNNSGNSGTSVINGSSITVDVGAIQTINLYLKGHAYSAKGQCPQEDGVTWYGVNELVYQDSYTASEVDSNEKYLYCFAKFNSEGRGRYTSAYYKVQLFYKFEFPVLSEFLAIKVDGMTAEIFDVQEDGYTANSPIFARG